MTRKAAGAGRLARVLALLLAAAGAAGPEARPQEAANAAVRSFSESDVKAAFLYNFAGYVQWPAAADTDEISFAILNATAVEASLERFAQGRSLQGRPVRVRRLRSITDLESDEVLFIGSSENARLAQLIDAVEGPTLIVTDSPDGLADGAMINFQIIDRRVRFEIALPAAQAAGLTLSSRLLSAALRVETTRCWIECRESPGSPESFSSAPKAAGVERGPGARLS